MFGCIAFHNVKAVYGKKIKKHRDDDEGRGHNDGSGDGFWFDDDDGGDDEDQFSLNDNHWIKWGPMFNDMISQHRNNPINNSSFELMETYLRALVSKYINSTTNESPRPKTYSNSASQPLNPNLFVATYLLPIALWICVLF